jgi:hypothetical protein
MCCCWCKKLTRGVKLQREDASAGRVEALAEARRQVVRETAALGVFRGIYVGERTISMNWTNFERERRY